MHRPSIPKGFVIFMVVVVIIVCGIISSLTMRKTTYHAVITDDTQFEYMVYECVSHYKNQIIFQTTYDFSTYDFNKLFRTIMDKDTYIGCELYRYDFRYTENESGLMDVDMRIQNPAWHRVLLTKWRVKQIADKLRGLSTYDQIKAVHDYLIVTNEYSQTIGSAFNALYVNKSSCNGYAFSFYAIMEELGIPATVEYGGSHAWNLVEMDGEWYNIDCTWDDKGGSNISYNYFLKSNEDFPSHEHYSATASKSFEMSEAKASEYYRKIPHYKTIMIVTALCVPFAIYFSFVIGKKIKEDNDRKKFYGN